MFVRILALAGLGAMLAVGGAHAAPNAPPKKGQTACLPETETTSPRHSKLKGDDPKSAEVLRTDLDNDGDADILERWWNGRRVRWFDENDNMSDTDLAGDMTDDSLQVDRDGDGFYDGPDDVNMDWVDDDGDGDADLQIFAINPNATQPTVAGGPAHYMIFEDVDDDNVLGYMDWQTFDFPCWRATNTTAYKDPNLHTSFSPDYNGNSIFLKEHLPAWAIEDPRLSWENPFAFYDHDGDGVTEQAVRFCDSRKPRPKKEDGIPTWGYDSKIDEAFTSFDLDNDTQRGNEMDYDMSLRFSGGEELEYSGHVHKHPKLKAPGWVLPYFRYTNWRTIDELTYVGHGECFAEMFKPKWANAHLVFDEDDDDHRWERVEIYYPGDPYSTKRWDKNHKGGICGHPQSDTLGDRGEWDNDFSGRGKIYIGKWDGKIHLLGAETGAWTVDRHSDYWGSWPNMGDSSTSGALKVEEVVLYRDTDGNGFFDEIAFDYDGDKTPETTVSLLDAAYGGDEAEVLDTVGLGWKGLHKVFREISAKSWGGAQRVYRAAWRKGLNDAELDDLAIAASTAEQYDHAYWLKETVYRNLDGRLAAKGDADARAELRKLHFTGNDIAMAEFIEAREW